MSEPTSFTIEQFCKYMNQGKLMGGKCKKCGKIVFPPRPVCDNCFSKDFEWIEIPQTGKLLTYTVIHVAPTQFQSMTPYAVGIIELDNGAKLPGMVREVASDELKIGMSLKMVLEACSGGGQWPQWPRYHFKPL